MRNELSAVGTGRNCWCGGFLLHIVSCSFFMCWGALDVFSGCSIPAPQDSFSTTFLTNYGRGTTTCLRTVVGSKQGHAASKMLSLQQRFFYVS